MAARPERFLIWGAGGHGKVLADVVRSLGYALEGYIDRDASRLGSIAEPGGARVIMEEAAFLRGSGSDRRLSLGEGIALALGIGANYARLDAAMAVPDELLPALVHPSGVVSTSASLGPGTVIFPNAVVNAAARIGRAVIVNSAAVVEHDCVLGHGVHVAPGAILLGGVAVERGSWIGAGAVILPGTCVGADAVVGAGAVVRRDVAAGTKVVGVPARAVDRGREGGS